MIAKVNDRYVTVEEAQAMTPQEYKNFEERLRSVARRQGFRITKYNHPQRGPLYSVSNDRQDRDMYDKDIIEIKDYLYRR